MKFFSLLCCTLTMVSAICLFAEEADYQDSDEFTLDYILEHTMRLLDANLRHDGLRSIRKQYGLSEDEFSSMIVKLAQSLTNSNDIGVHSFTVASLMTFGTTNALDYLEDEANNTNRYVGGIGGYVLITGFDDRSFKFLDEITADKSRSNYSRRLYVYSLLGGLLNSKEEYYRRHISDAMRHNTCDFLLKAVSNDFDCSFYLDEILSHYDPSYAKSEERRQIALRVMSDTNVLEYTRQYYKAELAKLEAAEAETNLPRMVDAPVECALTMMADSESGSTEQKNWREWIAVGVGAVALLAGAVAWRRKSRAR